MCRLYDCNNRVEEDELPDNECSDDEVDEEDKHTMKKEFLFNTRTYCR